MGISLSAQADKAKAGIKKLKVTHVVFTAEDFKSNPEDIVVANHEAQRAHTMRSLQEKTDQLDADLLAIDTVE